MWAWLREVIRAITDSLLSHARISNRAVDGERRPRMLRRAGSRVTNWVRTKGGSRK
jgi:hypothetical protein